MEAIEILNENKSKIPSYLSYDYIANEIRVASKVFEKCKNFQDIIYTAYIRLEVQNAMQELEEENYITLEELKNDMEVMINEGKNIKKRNG